jgi:AmiR/NasT family two-component response regulator
LANAQLYWDSRQLNQNLNQAMESRATIEHAVGIVMAGGGKTPEEAFEVLARASQRQNRKLREIAVEIVERAQTRTP